MRSELFVRANLEAALVLCEPVVAMKAEFELSKSAWSEMRKVSEDSADVEAGVS